MAVYSIHYDYRDAGHTSGTVSSTYLQVCTPAIAFVLSYSLH